MVAEIDSKLNNVQLHLLKLFSKKMDDNSLDEIKEILTEYFYKKVIEIADSEWDKKNYDDNEMDKWVFEGNR